MYCYKCGKELPNDSKFCYYCGSRAFNPDLPAEDSNEDAPLSKATEEESVVPNNNAEKSQSIHNSEDKDEPKAHEDVSSDFKVLSEKAKSLKQIYFELGAQEVHYKELTGYAAVCKCYDDAAAAGGNSNSSFMENLADFIIKAHSETTKSEKRPIKNLQKFVNNYSGIMDKAILNADSIEKKRLQEKKQNTISEINSKLDQELNNSVSSSINNYPDTEEETSSDIKPITKIKPLLDTIKKLFYANNRISKRNIFITYVVVIVVLVGIVILYSTIKSSTASKSSSFSNSDSSKENTLHSKDVDRSNNPEGYNADVFEDCGYNSNILGKKLREVADEYNLRVYYSETFQEDDRAYSIWPIIAKKGQTVARAIEKNKSKSPNYFFILDDKDYVVGFIYEARGGLKGVSTFCKNLKIPPRKAACNPKMTNEDYVLCWKYGYGYHFIFARGDDYSGLYCMGYSDLIDPSQCLEFDNVVYSPIEQQYTGGNKMPENIYDSLYGYFDNQIDNQEDNVRIEVVSSNSIHRSLLNCSANKKDYYYIDRFDSYESLGNNRYLIKVKCGDTKLSYLSEDVFNDDGTGHQTLYFNAVDGWNYSDNYIKNSKYIFYREFTYGDANLENNNVEEKAEPEIPNDNTAKTANTIMGELPLDILSEISGHYEDECGDTVDLSSPNQMVRFIKGGNQSHTYDEKICGYKKTQDGYLLCIEWDGEKYTYLYKKTGETEYLYIGFDDGWDPNLDPYNYNEATVFIKKADKPEEPASSETNSSIDTSTTEVSDNELYSALARVDQAIFDYGNYGKKPYFESNTKDLAILADNYRRFTTGSVELNGEMYPVVDVEVNGDTVLFWYDEMCITWNRGSDTVISEIYDEY